MEVNVKEFMEIAGYAVEKERDAAVALGAHFEVAVREIPIEEAQKKLELAKAAYAWFKDQREVAEIKGLFSFGATSKEDDFWADQERNYRMVLWMAEQTVKIVQDGDFKFPEHLRLDRKHTGAYYTPRSLIEALLDSALDPVIEQALNGSDQPTIQERKNV